MWRIMGCISIVLLFSTAARADLLVHDQGDLGLRVEEVKILSANDKFIVYRELNGHEHRITRQGIAGAVVTGEHGEVVLPPDRATSQAAETRLAARKWKVPAEPVAPPVVAAASPSYYVITLHGEVGDTLSAGILERSLADAAARKPTVVILDIDSPGGLVSEAKSIIKILHHYNKQLRIVALVDKDLSAAAIFSLSCKEIYVKPTGTIGAATSFVPTQLWLPPKIEEKMQSAWRAVARSSAEEGGHEPLLADAMIDSSRELHLEESGGKVVVKEGPGGTKLCDKGKILTLTSREAIACGLAAGEAEDCDELGKLLKYPNWKECKGYSSRLTDAWMKRAPVFKAELMRLSDELKDTMARAAEQDPTNFDYTKISVTEMRGGGGGMMLPGGLHGAPIVIPGRPQTTTERTIPLTPAAAAPYWYQNSLRCVVTLQKGEENVRETISLCQAYQQYDRIDSLKEVLEEIATLRAKTYDRRHELPPAK